MLRGEEANWLAESRWTDIVSICKYYVRVCKEKDDDGFFLRCFRTCDQSELGWNNWFVYCSAHFQKNDIKMTLKKSLCGRMTCFFVSRYRLIFSDFRDNDRSPIFSDHQRGRTDFEHFDVVEGTAVSIPICNLYTIIVRTLNASLPKFITI